MQRSPMASRLWLAVHLPFFPLEVFGCSQATDTPMAVSSGGSRPRILLGNSAALAAGVRSGLAVEAARALLAGLRVLVRDEPAEQAALQRLAAWAGQYSSQVSLEPPQTLFLEVAGSSRLFGGIEVIRTGLVEGLARLGYAPRLAVAPTPQGALWLARAGRQTLVTDREALRKALGPLPLHYLPLDDRMLSALRQMGLEQFGDLLRLPQQGLRRRLGSSAMGYLQQLLGQVAEPRRFFQPPAGFSGQISLPAEVESGEALLFSCRRLILEMCGYLVVQARGVQRLDWTLEHADQSDSRFSLGLVKPMRDGEHFLALLRERLARLDLPAPVQGVGLKAAELQPLGPACDDLFADPDSIRERDPDRLLERLRARLGEAAVYGLQSLPEHRPERAWARCPPALGGEREAPVVGQRPLWLLPIPQPLTVRDGLPWWQGRLQLEPERERIEAGWWDGGAIARDYFVAHTATGERLWIYRELHPPHPWYLHGFWG